ncbi:hypothetical protein CI102_7388 [Trichoderma harzianum]|nr:hypothetical protein CI102_7388 [Trichoderma harzianum]
MGCCIQLLLRLVSLSCIEPTQLGPVDQLSGTCMVVSNSQIAAHCSSRPVVAGAESMNGQIRRPIPGILATHVQVITQLILCHGICKYALRMYIHEYSPFAFLPLPIDIPDGPTGGHSPNRWWQSIKICRHIFHFFSLQVCSFQPVLTLTKRNQFASIFSELNSGLSGSPCSRKSM